MNGNNILEFLEKYKNLDELCKQILSSDRGVSEYIDEMSKESRGYRIAGWERDYKQLKRLRWIRNRLVHESGSFEAHLVKIEDIQWLHTFYLRIMECKDPFSILHQFEKNVDRKNGQIKHPDTYISTNRNSSLGDLSNRNLILAVVLVGILVFAFLCFIIFFGIVLIFEIP